MEETKEMKVEIPDGYEIDKENSTFECIKFNPKKKVRYKDVANRLFYNTHSWYINESGVCRYNFISSDEFANGNNCLSEQQGKKLIAINKMMNVAKYLNDDWQPDNNNPYEIKWKIGLDSFGNVRLDYHFYCDGFNIYFKSKELAIQAIDILGKNNIKLALSNDW